LGIPNLNSLSITINFVNLVKECVRRLGRPTQVGAASALLDRVPSATKNDIEVTYDTSYKPKLEMTWIRLPSWRQYPQSSALATYRRDVRRSVDQEFGDKVFSKGLFDDNATKKGLAPVAGLQAISTAFTAQPVAGSENATKTAQFNGLQFPQIPAFILCCFQKSSDVYNLQNPFFEFGKIDVPAAPGDYTNMWGDRAIPGADPYDTDAHKNLIFQGDIATFAVRAAHLKVADQKIACRYIQTNQASNCSIQQLEVQIQSAIGSWSFRESKFPYIQDRDLLWKRHRMNCCDDYMPAGRGAWASNESCALLACNDFLLGLSSSPGVTMPCIIDIKVKYANKASQPSGLCFSNGQVKGKMVFEDVMVGVPIVCAMFNSQILSIASSSAVLSAQSFSQSTFQSAISQQG
jgi:hypothetical protein